MIQKHLAHNVDPKLTRENSFLCKGFSSGASWPLLMAFAFSLTPSFAGQPPECLSVSSKPKPTQINVQEVKSSKGITAWVVETHEIPVVSVVLAFNNAGAAADPEGLSGMTQLIAGMLDEGSGDLDSQAFKKFLLKNNIELNVSSTQDIFQVSFRTIKKNVREAFHMLNAILTKPQFEEKALARVKNQLLSILQQSLNNEHTLASQGLNSVMFGTHPYGRQIQQVLSEFPKITADQMRQYIKDRFGRDQLIVSAVGDITSGELKDYLDSTFGALPEKATPIDIKDPVLPKNGTTVIKPLNIPQSLVRFAQPGVCRTDPRFYAAVLLLKILGDGKYESRLWDEIREKRGLAYEIEANVNWSQHSALFLGGTATKTSNAKQVISLIRKVWDDMVLGAIQSELDYAKKQLMGSFALNFSSTLKIAKALLVYQIDKLGIDYINKRNDIISALTLEDINKVAKSLLNSEQLSFVIVGEPNALSSQGLTQEKKPGASKP